MIRQLYRLLPASIRANVYLAVAKQGKQDENGRAQEAEAKLPHVELRLEHIQNMRVLVNRDALLDVLPKHSIVAELGVAQGDFSAKILSVTKPKELYLID